MGAREMQVGGNHYRLSKIQPWDVIEDWELGFFDGNVIKYIGRYQRKDGLQDLYKARHYLNKLIENYEEKADGISIQK